MANVLPIPEQKNLWRIHRARFIIAFSLMLLSLAALAALALMPSYFAIRFATRIESDGGVRNTAGQNMLILTRTQKQLSAIDAAFASSSIPTIALNRAISLRPAGTKIDRIRYERVTQGQISITGTASREALTAYRDALASEPMFKNVSVPVGALVGSVGDRFSITITGNF